MTFPAHAVLESISNGMLSSFSTRVWGLKSALGRTGYASLPNVAPGGDSDESCSVEICLDRLAAAYEDVGASQD
jgi:hypothetical protein